MVKISIVLGDVSMDVTEFFAYNHCMEK